MSKAATDFLACMKQAAWNRETVKIGGGIFTPADIKAAYPSLLFAAKVGNDTRALVSEMAAALGNGARWVSKGIADDAFAGCVLPKAAEHDAARMYAAIDAAKAALSAVSSPDPRDAIIAELVAALKAGMADEVLSFYDPDYDERRRTCCDSFSREQHGPACWTRIAAEALTRAAGNQVDFPTRPAVTIRVTVEGGVVQSIEADGSADVTVILLDFDCDDPGHDEARDCDGELCSAALMPVDYVPAECLMLPDDMARPKVEG